MTHDELVLGIDEAGMGSWAGPLYVAGVIWDDAVALKGLTDSKRLSQQQRERLYGLIEAHAVGLHVQEVSVERVNNDGLVKARAWGIQQIVASVEPRADRLLVDGVGSMQYRLPTHYIVRGDEKIPAISAASILAKVSRDRIMEQLSKSYPGYGFESHKGYGTKEHQVALQKNGLCEIHRIWYKPVQKFIDTANVEKV